MATCLSSFSRNPFGYAPWNQKRSFQASSPYSITFEVVED